MLAGMMSGPSLFEHLVPRPEPSADEMEAQAKAVQYNRTVKLHDLQVKTFDLGNVKEAAGYAKLLKEIYAGIQAKTHVILFSDRQFVTEGDRPRWIAHMEWMEFELKTTANPAVGKAKE